MADTVIYLTRTIRDFQLRYALRSLGAKLREWEVPLIVVAEVGQYPPWWLINARMVNVFVDKNTQPAQVMINALLLAALRATTTPYALVVPPNSLTFTLTGHSSVCRVDVAATIRQIETEGLDQEVIPRGEQQVLYLERALIGHEAEMVLSKAPASVLYTQRALSQDFMQWVVDRFHQSSYWER